MRNVFFLATIPMVSLSIILDRPWELEIHWESFFAVLLLGIFCGGWVYWMLAVLIRRSGPTFASLNNYLVTLFGVFLGILLMGDQLKIHDGIACVLILLALGVSQLRREVELLR